MKRSAGISCSFSFTRGTEAAIREECFAVRSWSGSVSAKVFMNELHEEGSCKPGWRALIQEVLCHRCRRFALIASLISDLCISCMRVTLAKTEHPIAL
jgi:hypothetical protein